MLDCTPRQASTMRRITQALIYLRVEAKAADLDEVAAAIRQAERCVSLISQTAPPPREDAAAPPRRAAARTS